MTHYNSFRWQEFERYDPLLDAQTVQFMAITDKGTFHVELQCEEGRERREYRRQFREHALALMDEGKEPCLIPIE